MVKSSFDLKWSATLLVLLFVATSSVFASDVYHDADGTVDALPGLPATMVVDAVDRVTGQVVLSGETFRYSPESELPVPARASEFGRSLGWAEISPGLQVIVLTDGTAPDGRHVPRVLRLWPAQ